MKKVYLLTAKLNLSSLTFVIVFLFTVCTHLKAQNMDVRGTVKIVDGT